MKKTDEFRIKETLDGFIIQKKHITSRKYINLDLSSKKLNEGQITSERCRQNTVTHFYTLESAKAFIRNELDAESKNNIEHESVIYHPYP